ncbi:Uu.00g115340.m01.CDS01 [Anthostomella pinea]|uniref:Uu.00g115340.m01.CDS01 n=1 Tax=Anthostomella pinea TaxID=933095 RepID=A0AAI8YGM6_9PEZI|nr:Uu.00g115340.m01.CDS01 [Anthostomella pinea]
MATSVSDCCLKGFQWNGTPSGRTTKLADLDTYTTGTNPRAAILLVHDLFGWTFPNIRLLADHYAAEADATVYVPDFFGGEVLPAAAVAGGPATWGGLDIPGFVSRNSRAIREPEVFAAARALREKGYERVAAVGFCFGGWAVFRLGAKEHEPEPLVDCITAGHPSWLTEEDVDGVDVPTQILAPEEDHAFTPELKRYAFEKLVLGGVAGREVEYVHFPGVAHACFTRGDEKSVGEREAMEKGKDKAVQWMKSHLHGKASA